MSQHPAAERQESRESVSEQSNPKRRGEAGQPGGLVRSDLYVQVQILESGGLDIVLHSKVEAFYGTSIRSLTAETMNRCGVAHARVVIDDRGAVPFVIEARLETAIRRAGINGSAPPERSFDPGPASEKDRPRRSRLYLPGNEPRFMVNAGLHRPDGVILDLEDSVHPNEKDAARLVVRNALRCVDFSGAERMVRINQLPLGLEDLDAVIPEMPDLILIPKVERADDVRHVDEHIRVILDRERINRPVWIMPILESALGIENAFPISSASDRVAAVTIGLEDYTADLGVPKTLEGTESLYARMRLSNAAHAAGIQAIDSVFGDVGNMDGLREWARHSRGLGFEGMGCIHPRQIAPIHDSFAPTATEIEKALRIVAAFEEASARGISVVSLGSRMIDPPVVLRAQRIVAAAERAGLSPDGES